MSMSNRHHVPIPSTSASSRLEHLLASFDDTRRQPSTSPVESYQPTIVRSPLPVTSSHRRPAQFAFKHANDVTTPAYFTQALLSNLLRPGPQPVQHTSNSSDDEEELAPITWPKSLHIPTQWNEEDKSGHLNISFNGKDVSFDGHPNGLDGRDAAAVRAECPIPAACGIYYYEVTILDRGVKGQISIGFATKKLPLSKLPGWDHGSWGYHGDDGHCFMGLSRAGAEFGPHFGTNDVIGCGINFMHRNAFYTKNGKFIGTVFSDLPERDIYPALGMRTPDEHVRTNFGESPFQFNIAAYVAQIKLNAWRDVQTNTVVRAQSVNEDKRPPAYRFIASSATRKQHPDDAQAKAFRTQEENLTAPITDLVLDYLVYHGYANSARALRQGIAQITNGETSRLVHDGADHLGEKDDGSISMEVDDDEPPNPNDEVRRRAQIMNDIRKGDIEAALATISTYYPSALMHDRGIIRFKLRCRQFVELVLEALRARRRLARDTDTVAMDGSGAVATEAANGMDLDDEEHPTASWGNGAVNGNSTPTIRAPSKGKGKSTTRRRRSSASRPPPSSSARAPSRGRGLASPMSPTAPRREIEESAAMMEKVINYGTSLRREWQSDQRAAVKDQLEKTIGLVAYEDPETDSHAKHLVSLQARLDLAEEVNATIMLSMKGAQMPTIERVYRHTATTMEAIGAMGKGVAAFMDVSRILDE